MLEPAAESSEGATLPIPGFYVAHHRWFDADRGAGALHKVGHTGDLRRRLTDGAYVTAFSGGFRYVHTFETSSKAEAHRLEAGVLRCAAARRLKRPNGTATELVWMRRAELAALAARVAEALHIAGVARDSPPEYPPPRRASSAEQARARVLSPAEERGLAGLELTPAEPTIDDLIDGLLGGSAAPQPPNILAGPASTTESAASRAPRAPRARKSVEEYLREARQALSRQASAPLRGDRGDSGDSGDSGEAFADVVLGELLAPQDSGGTSASFEDREYQVEAVAACRAELEQSGRAILQMACRCGKTRVAHGVMRAYLGRGPSSRVLYLVPGLALLRQTVRKLDRYGLAGVEVLLVGSDGRPVPGLETLRPRSAGSAAAGTTDPDEIRRACAAGAAPLLVVSTYQSSALVPDVFGLTVFDESHRVCGPRHLRPFTHVLLEHGGGDRLFMTATPRYDAPLSMKDRALFGGVAYAYHMRQGIDAGYVNRFGLELVGRPRAAGVADSLATAGQIVAALDRVLAATPAAKLLVFCRTIRHAGDLRRGVAAALAARAAPGAACLAAHSRMPRAGIAAALARFCAPGEAAVLFNCRLFQEGVEIPPLNGVFFASPRHSPRDIIQSLCRPLNVQPGKPPSKVFVPVAYEPGAAPGAPQNLARFASIIPYFDALIAEDPLLYEHLLDPRGTPYPLRWVDSAVAPLRYDPGRLLAAARRSVRRGGCGKTERLLRAARIPWAIGFAELRRIVAECGRYPKGNDTYVYHDAKVNFGHFYRHVRDSYAKWRAGKPQPLEPHQLRALEGLPGWDPYGVEGPYPWAETLAFLEQWLEGHGGALPPLNISNGGYVGLEATPMERLSGTLTCVNQGDGRDRKGRGGGARRPGSGLTLEASKQRDLDALCARWGLCWRKERLPPPPGSPPGAVGSLVENGKGEYAGAKTFIQKAYDRFKVIHRTQGAGARAIQRWYPGFPLKHRRMERADVWARRREIVPPRWRGRSKTEEPAAGEWLAPSAERTGS